MEHTREDNVVNDIKEAIKIFNDVRRNLLIKKQRELDINSIKRKLYIIF